MSDWCCEPFEKLFKEVESCKSCNLKDHELCKIHQESNFFFAKNYSFKKVKNSTYGNEAIIEYKPVDRSCYGKYRDK